MKHFVLDSFALLVFFEQQKDWEKVEGILASLTKKHKAKLITGDPEFKKLSTEIVLEWIEK